MAVASTPARKVAIRICMGVSEGTYPGKAQIPRKRRQVVDRTLVQRMRRTACLVALCHLSTPLLTRVGLNRRTSAKWLRHHLSAHQMVRGALSSGLFFSPRRWRVPQELAARLRAEQDDPATASAAASLTDLGSRNRDESAYCFASTSPKEPIYQCTRRLESSISVPEKPWASTPQQISCAECCADRLTSSHRTYFASSPLFSTARAAASAGLEFDTDRVLRRKSSSYRQEATHTRYTRRVVSA
jgi:hypothetical protein